MKTLPGDVAAYKQTREFDQETVPAGLLRAHTTREGTWGRVVVLEGELAYRIFAHGQEPEEVTLSPEVFGVIEPQVPHEVEPRGAVRFFVEFWR